MDHMQPTPDDNIHVLAPPSSLFLRRSSHASAPMLQYDDNDDQTRPARPLRPRQTSHRAIMRLHSHRSMELISKEPEGPKNSQTCQNVNPTNDNAARSSARRQDDATGELFFTPPGRASYLPSPSRSPQSPIGLDIDMPTVTAAADDPSSPPCSQVTKTPPPLPRKHTAPFASKHPNVSNLGLCIDDVLGDDEEPDEASDVAPPASSATTKRFRLQMKRPSLLNMTRPTASMHQGELR
jgi:hypothetical protein